LWSLVVLGLVDNKRLLVVVGGMAEEVALVDLELVRAFP
jgi:hypothetical protein